MCWERSEQSTGIDLCCGFDECGFVFAVVSIDSHQVLKKKNPPAVFLYVITRMPTLNKLLSRVISTLVWCGLHVKLETIQQLIIQLFMMTGFTPQVRHSTICH